MAREETFVMVKPNAVERGLVGEIISRLERKGLRLDELHLIEMSRDRAERLYVEHEGKSFYEDLVRFVTSGRVVVVRCSGKSAVSVVRTLIGATDPVEAAPGTIRGDYGLEIGENLVHGSDSLESAERELGIFFGE